MMKDELITNEENRYYRFSQFQIAKAYWKLIEKEWIEWLDDTHSQINISEHTILNILYIHGKMPITVAASLGVMHVSTAMNFSKALTLKGFINTEKSLQDRRTTYISLTEAGKNMIEQIENEWRVEQSELLTDIIGLENVLGYKPEFPDLVNILRTSYGKEQIDNMLDKEKWHQTFGAMHPI